VENQYDRGPTLNLNKSVMAILAPKIIYNYPQFRMERVVFNHFEYEEKSLSVAYIHGFIQLGQDIKTSVRYLHNYLYDFEFIGGPR
jgi:hypothetical protein